MTEVRPPTGRASGLTVLLLGGLFGALSILAGSLQPLESWRLFEGLLMAMAGVAAVTVAYLVRRGPPVSRVELALVLLVGLGARTAFLGQEPSNDVYRYLWEGRVQLAGVNPYAVPPDAPELESLRTAWHAKINHPSWTAIYGPLAQGCFALVAAAGESVIVWKLLVVALDLLVMGLVLWMLARRGSRLGWIVAYAWHPLVLWTLAGEAHLDALVLVLMVGAIAALLADRELLAGGLIGALLLVKVTAVVLVPLLLIPRVRWRGLLVAAALLVIGHLPFAGAGWGLFDSIWRFGSDMRFNDLITAVLGTGIDPIVHRGIAVAVMATTLFVLHRRRAGPVRTALALCGMFLLVSPTVHPWYGLLLVPLACLEPRTCWWALTISLVLAGETRAIEWVTGRWEEPRWVALAVFIPVAAAAALTTLPVVSQRHTLESSNRLEMQ